MSLRRVVGFSGNLRRPSKTRALVNAVGIEVSSRRSCQFDLFDVLDAGPGLGSAMKRDELSIPAARVIQAIENADALIIGTPVYKGAYTGLFKHLFDLVDPQALVGKPIILTATGGGPRHALVVEHVLRPLFGFFTALTVPTAVYASESDFEDGGLAASDVVARLRNSAIELAALLDLKTDQAVSDWSPASVGPRGLKVVGAR